MEKFFQQQSIFKRLFLSFVSLNAVVLLSAIFFYYQSAIEDINAEIQDDFAMQLNNAEQLLEKAYLTPLNNTFSLMDTSPSIIRVRTLPEKEARLIRYDIERKFFQIIKNNPKLIESIRFIDQSGQEKVIVEGKKRIRKYHSLIPGNSNFTNDKKLDRFFSTIRSGVPGKIYYSPIDKNTDARLTFLMGITLSEPDIGGFGGAVIARCNLQEFANHIENIRYKETAIARLALPSSQSLGQDKTPSENIAIKFYQDISPGYDYTYKDPFLRLIFTLPDSVIKKQNQNIIRSASMAAIFALILTLVVSYLISRQIIKPVERLVDESHRFSTGDFSPIEELNDKTEIGQLGQAMNAMADKISQNQSELESLIEERTLELIHAKDEAEQANFEKSRFLANMSHELRTPMHAILSYADLTKKRVDEEKTLRFLENITTSGKRLTRLLNDLLDLSKLEAGKLEASFKPNDLNKLVEESVAELNSLADDKALTIEVLANDKCEGVFDEKLICQVITNLLSNAIKFSPVGGRIRLKTTSMHAMLKGERKDILEFVICDQGIGIPTEELDTIFDRFIQSSKTRTAAGGTGLGLPICKEILRLHHGVIWATSPVTAEDMLDEDGSASGTALHIRFPVNQPETK